MIASSDSESDGAASSIVDVDDGPGADNATSNTAGDATNATAVAASRTDRAAPAPAPARPRRRRQGAYRAVRVLYRMREPPHIANATAGAAASHRGHGQPAEGAWHGEGAPADFRAVAWGSGDPPGGLAGFDGAHCLLEEASAGGGAAACRELPPHATEARFGARVWSPAPPPTPAGGCVLAKFWLFPALLRGLL